AATECLFGAGALPSGFRGALEAFLRRNEAFQAAAPSWDVSALAVYIDPQSARAQAAAIQAAGRFGLWRTGGGTGLLNPALRDREAAIERLTALAPDDSLVRAWQRFRTAIPRGRISGLALEATSATLAED